MYHAKINHGIILTLILKRRCDSKITDWESLDGKWPDSSDPVVVINTDGRLEVFMVGDDKVLYHKWQTRPGGSWT